jgi:FKBP-type peptidyl-prolyl cis-trans isomerase SlyD
MDCFTELLSCTPDFFEFVHGMIISKDTVVLIDYTLTNDSGEILDASNPGNPLAYLHGKGHIIPGLENALEGKRAGDTLRVDVAPEQGYGVRDEKLLVRVNRKEFENIDDLAVGMQFQAETNQGVRILTIMDIGDSDVVLDGNHPLAGVSLTFDVTVSEVREPTPQELAHGHVHSGGSCGNHSGECCGKHSHGCCDDDEDSHGCCDDHEDSHGCCR